MIAGEHNAANLFQQLSPTQIVASDFRVHPFDCLPYERLANGLPALMPPVINGYRRAGAWVWGELAWDPDFNTADMRLSAPAGRLV